MASAPAIEIAALAKTYRGGVRALAGLDLRVEQGEILAFLGPNGAGKSTTIRLLLDLIRPRVVRSTGPRTLVSRRGVTLGMCPEICVSSID